MWDTVQDQHRAGGANLTHDLPCARCGHALHTFLACSDSCRCTPCVMPGVLVGV